MLKFGTKHGILSTEQVSFSQSCAFFLDIPESELTEDHQREFRERLNSFKTTLPPMLCLVKLLNKLTPDWVAAFSRTSSSSSSGGGGGKDGAVSGANKADTEMEEDDEEELMEYELVDLDEEQPQQSTGSEVRAQNGVDTNGEADERLMSCRTRLAGKELFFSVGCFVGIVEIRGINHSMLIALSPSLSTLIDRKY